MKVAVSSFSALLPDLSLRRLLQFSSMQMGRTLGRRALSERGGEALGSVHLPRKSRVLFRFFAVCMRKLIAAFAQVFVQHKCTAGELGRGPTGE